MAELIRIPWLCGLSVPEGPHRGGPGLDRGPRGSLWDTLACPGPGDSLQSPGVSGRSSPGPPPCAGQVAARWPRGRARLLPVGRVRGVRGGAGRARVPPRPGLAPVVVVRLAVGFMEAFPGARPAGPGQSVGRVVAVGESPAVPGRRRTGRARGPGSPGRARVSHRRRRVVEPVVCTTARAVSLLVVGAPVVAVVPGARGALGCVRNGRWPSRPAVATRSGGLTPGWAPPLHCWRAAAAVSPRRPLPGQRLNRGAWVPPRAAGGRPARSHHRLLLLLLLLWGPRAAGLADHGGIGHVWPGGGGGLGELAATPPRSAGTRC